MRIRRFNENLVELSFDRVDEMLNEIEEFLSTLVEKDKYFDSIINELKNYQDLSSKNDQIDDSIFKIENSKKDLSNIITELSIVVDNLNSYKNKNNKDISDKSIDF
jgi:hypothetical protein